MASGDSSLARSFGRVFTRRLGLLSEFPQRPDLTLMESRILYEIAHWEGARAQEIGGVLGVDKGNMSRALRSLEHRLLIKRGPAADAARGSALSLTEKGLQLVKAIDAEAERRASGMLKTADPDSEVVLAARLAEIELMLDPARSVKMREVRLTDLEPGDLGWVIGRHGEVYAREFGWDFRFEALVAEIASAFAKKRDPKRERAWIAKARGLRLGCVFLVRQDEKTARLRILLVDPLARRIGLGTRLVDECLRFAKGAGYRRVVLWTNSVLESARKIYEAAGFELVKEETHRSFGKELVGQYWAKDLSREC